MKLSILGSGSPEAYVRRASSGYLLEIGQDKILFDCGGGVFDNLLRAGLRPSDITHIFFTHFHSDHMMDYARLVHAAWDEGGAAIKVHGPSPIKGITNAYFGQDGVMSHDLRARTELKPSQDVWVARGGALPRPWPAPNVTEIAPGFSFDGDGWTLASCEVPHAQPILDCMAFSVSSNGKKFVYSGDAGICDPLGQLAQNADLLLHWCYRLDGEEANPMMKEFTPTPSQIGEMAKKSGVKNLMLTHFRKHMDRSGANEAAIDAASKAHGSSVRIAEDLMEIEI
ncbi:MAG: MBL fold metallo-hydrolase [Amylibacter sp.]|jgi:ribonuclease Z|nr:MBL fold metallo-hydrolase [Amylibacter sp.]